MHEKAENFLMANRKKLGAIKKLQRSSFITHPSVFPTTTHFQRKRLSFAILFGSPLLWSTTEKAQFL
jgi:hypothetical protein